MVFTQGDARCLCFCCYAVQAEAACKKRVSPCERTYMYKLWQGSLARDPAATVTSEPKYCGTCAYVCLPWDTRSISFSPAHFRSCPLCSLAAFPLLPLHRPQLLPHTLVLGISLSWVRTVGATGAYGYASSLAPLMSTFVPAQVSVCAPETVPIPEAHIVAQAHSHARIAHAHIHRGIQCSAPMRG